MTQDLSVAALAALSDTELLERLGSLLLDDALPFGAEDPERPRRFAERWLDERLPQIRERLCGGTVDALLAAPTRDAMLEAATLADALAASFGRPPAVTIAVILCRRGLETICADDMP